jgi:hypothetical protein
LLLVAYECLDIDATAGGEGAARPSAVIDPQDFDAMVLHTIDGDVEQR